MGQTTFFCMADQKIIRKTYQATETKAAGENRRLIVTISTSNPDRSHDVVMPQGMVADAYNRNPVVAAFHRYDQPAIARTLSLTQTDNAIIAELEFLPKGIYPLADQLYEMYKGGFMNAWSIGFIPKEATDLDPNIFAGGRRFDKWELLEYSAVLVPDNPDALTMLRSKGISEEVIEQGTHVEPEADRKEVEKEIKQAVKATERLEAGDPGSMVKVHDTTPSFADLQEVLRGIEKEKAEVKEGRVLSSSNRKAISGTVAQMKSAIESMEALLKATEKPETSEQPKDSQPPATEPKAAEIPLVEALKLADKVVGRALRDYNATKEN